MDRIKIAFLGDVILNKRYAHNFESEKGYFNSLAISLTEYDFVIANLESMIPGDDILNPLKKKSLETSGDALDYLKQIGINIVTLANNHVYDFQKSGFLKTTEKLKLLNINWFGAQANKQSSINGYVIEKNNIRIGLLNYVDLDTNPGLDSSCEIDVNILEPHKVIQDINALRDSVDHIVLLLHWGGLVEYSMTPHLEQTKLAKKFINAGVDLIIGHHSHTVQPMEIYADKEIYYSIGNLCMDLQNLNYRKKRMMHGIVIGVEFSKKNYSTKKISTINEGLNVAIVSNNSRLPIINTDNILVIKIKNFFHCNFEREINRLTHNFYKLFRV
ncbi:MAG: CapA family protein [Flavobacteriaceae bacterium]|nr:CapA family protein [Flavobacteriaceae bacterium]